MKATNYSHRVVPLRIGIVTVATSTLLCGVASADVDDALWRAIGKVESNHDSEAYNRREGAAGVVQVRPIVVKDCNRIAKLKKLSKRWSNTDRWDPDKSREIFEFYTSYYAKAFKVKPTAEVRARIWNGGPKGFKKSSTLRYWRKVRRAMRIYLASKESRGAKVASTEKSDC